MSSGSDALQRAPGALISTPLSQLVLYEGPIPSLIGCTILLVSTGILPLYVFVDESSIGRAFQKYKAHPVKIIGKLRKDFKPIHKVRGEFEVPRDVLGITNKLPLTPEEINLISELAEYRDVEKDFAALCETAVEEKEVAYDLYREEDEDEEDNENSAENSVVLDDSLDDNSVVFQDENPLLVAAVVETDPESIAVFESERTVSFNEFWEAYGNKKDFSKASQKWDELTPKEKASVMLDIPNYLNSISNRMFQKSPVAYLAGRSWDN